MQLALTEMPERSPVLFRTWAHMGDCCTVCDGEANNLLCLLVTPDGRIVPQSYAGERRVVPVCHTCGDKVRDGQLLAAWEQGQEGE